MLVFRHVDVVCLCASQFVMLVEDERGDYMETNTPTQYGYKTQHSTVTALHTLNNTVAKGFNQMAPPCTNNKCSTRYSKAFDTINIHTLIRKLLQANILGTIIKFIANYTRKKTLFLTTAATQQTFPQTPTQSLQQI